MNAKEYLAQVEDLDNKINRMLGDAKNWRDMAFSINQDTTQPHYNPNRSTHAPFEKCIENADALEREATAAIDRLVDLKVEILTTLNKLTDDTGKEILRMRYIELVPWNEIRMKFGYSDSWIFKKRNKALDELDEILKVSSPVQ